MDNYCTLPERDLSIEEVFIRSLDSAWEFSQKLFCMLFYLDNRDKSESIQSRNISRTEQISAISNFNRISRREEINELFEQLGQVLDKRFEALLIGRAVMLELGLKDAIRTHLAKPSKA